MALNLTIDHDVVTAAVSKAAGTGRLVSVVLPADAELDGAAVLAALPSGDRAMWWQPDKQRLAVTSGVATRLEAPVDGPRTSFGSIDLDKARAMVDVVDPYSTGLQPWLIGGFSFFADDVWGAFGPGDLVLPEVGYIREGDDAAWIITTPAADGAAVIEALTEVSRRVRPAYAVPSPNGSIQLTEPDRVRSRGLIEATINAIRTTDLDKVVIARTATAELEVDVPLLTAVLAARYPGCATYAFERGGEWFVGATPELLVRKQGAEVASAALAATAPRQIDPVLDRIELESLQTSKQLAEHRFVVEAVVDALEDAGVSTTVQKQEVLELRRVRHLATAIEGVAGPDTDVLDLVEALHPTPAVGGVPGSGALEWIDEHETFTRGWYAAPVGIVDLAGDGEFMVALRGVRIDGSTVHFYAGAGIVAGSDPDAEMDEIDLKLGVMGGAVASAR